MISERKLREDLMVQVGMWADDNRFGTGLDQDDYEEECKRLTDGIYDDIHEALVSRTLR